jgi:ABC-2 type transport system ATP-binding protein
MATRFRADLYRPLGQLSRGNRQKIGLLQAVFHEPELLILDEPTSGLDPMMQEEFLKVVAEQREAGRTVLLSSHELDEVERVCDRVGIIRDGRLIAVERVSDLVEKSYRHVSLTFAEPVDRSEVDAIPGVSDVTVADGRITFRAIGDIDPIVKAAARHRLVDMQLTHPSLEEVFLAYYDDEEGAA